VSSRITEEELLFELMEKKDFRRILRGGGVNARMEDFQSSSWARLRRR
jgi:hypothetical protein